MDWTHGATALAGAALTVVVQQGTAMVTGPDGSSVQVEAGDRYETVAGGEAPAAAGTGTRRVEIPADASPEVQVAALRRENAQLQEELDGLRFEAKMARGQLARVVGEPAEWPDNPPAALSPETFESTLKEMLEGREGVELVSVDCSEYPCVARLSSDDFEGRGDPFTEELGERFGTALGEDMGGMLVMAGESEGEDGELHPSVIGLAVLPSEDPDGSLQKRAAMRVQEAMDEGMGR